MTNQIHIAAQYLATAGINFLTKKDDDSHTNLGFISEKGHLETWPLNDKGYKLILEYAEFRLRWSTNDENEQAISLDGKTHQEIVQWIDSVTAVLGKNTAYNYQLHYDLPYEKITDDFVFQKPSKEELNALLEVRIIAQKALEDIVRELELDTAIRIWPHHFDTGGYAVLDASKNISVGFGLAIPDTLVDDFYLYTSGYNSNGGIDTASFGKLTLGSWKNEGFKGAIAPMKGMDKAKAIAFFKETILTYKAL